MRLEFSELEKYYGREGVFHHVSATVNDHEIIGLIGNNGAGKSTLCNILAKTDSDYDGIIKYYAGTKVAYFKQMQESSSLGELCVFDYILHTQQHLLDLETRYNAMLKQIGTQAYDEKAMNEFGSVQEDYFNKGAFNLLERISTVLHGLGIFETAEESAEQGKRNITWNTQLKNLSGGERKIVELATILLDTDANVLILDEPTNHLDMEARAWLESFILGFQGSIILVSHDRHLLNKVAQTIWEIADYALTVYPGNYDRFEEQKESKMEALWHQYETQQKELKRLEAVRDELYRKVKLGGGPAIVGQYNAMKSRIEHFKDECIPEPAKDREALQFTLTSLPPAGYASVKMDHFSFSFDEKSIFDDQSATIIRGDKVALLGANGIGKSTLFKLILTKYCFIHALSPKEFGIEEFYDHNIATVHDDKSFSVGPSVKIGYYSQHHSQLPDEQTIRELLHQHGIDDEGKFQNIIRRFHFTKDTVDEKKIGDLSGGEKSKLQFILLMLSGANFLLLDEPINHLDIASMKVVEDVLSRYQGSLMVISHDRYFLSKIVNRIMYIQDHKVNEFWGNIDEYMLQKSR